MSLTARQEAEAVEQFGDDLRRLDSAFGQGLSNATVDRVCAVANQEHLATIAMAFQALGAAMSAECDEAEELADRLRDNPLEPDFRRLGQ